MLPVALAACALLCALPAHALASKTEESILMDDNQTIYATPSHMAATLRAAKNLGVDRIKVSVVWSLVAPDNSANRKPRFDATNPSAYPFGAWTRYDELVTWCRLLGLKVYFQVTAPAPTWATSGPTEAQGDGYRWSEKPNPTYFRQFVEAIGRRYDGRWQPASWAALAPPRQLGVSSRGVKGVTPTSSDPDPPLQPVRYWGVWNEPNIPGWLSPQFKRVGGHQVDNSPGMYRHLVEAAYSGLKASGHKHDTFLIGELASHGSVYPIPFAQELYCLDSRYRPLTGKAAAHLECPQSGSRSKFVSRNPGLFAFDGFAYHPYSFGVAPNQVLPDRNEITLANLGEIERALDRVHAVYGRRVRGGVNMYLTEWGYKTRPPNPFVDTSLTQQAEWINEGEYMTYHDPRVTSLAQFLLVDNDPRAGAPPGSRAYWSTFQTGLVFADGKHKPSYAAFRLPLWLPSARHGSRVTVWGEIRAASHSQTQTGTLQFRRRGSRRWGSVDRVRTRNREGFFVVRVRIPAAGELRLLWQRQVHGKKFYSRTVAIS
jgi:hypothetical protein